MKQPKLVSGVAALLISFGASAPLPAAEDADAAQQPPSREEPRDHPKKASPEGREAKGKEGHERHGGARSDFRKLTPEEREAKRKEIRERFQKHLAELRKKKAAGTLTPEEQRRLTRMEDMAKRFEQQPGPRPAPAPSPAGKPSNK